MKRPPSLDSPTGAQLLQFEQGACEAAGIGLQPLRDQLAAVQEGGEGGGGDQTRDGEGDVETARAAWLAGVRTGA